mgnify:CR=1 FL=1
MPNTVAKMTEAICEYKRFCWDCYLVIAGCLLMLGIMHRHYFYGAVCVPIIGVLVLLIRLFIKKYRSLKLFWGMCIIIMMVVLMAISVQIMVVKFGMKKQNQDMAYMIEL